MMKKFTTILTVLIAMTITTNAQWTAQTSGTTENLASVYFIDANTGYAVGKSGTILKTTDGGTNWTALSSGITSGLGAVYFTDANTGYIGGEGKILKTINGGKQTGHLKQ